MRAPDAARSRSVRRPSGRDRSRRTQPRSSDNSHTAMLTLLRPTLPRRVECVREEPCDERGGFFVRQGSEAGFQRSPATRAQGSDDHTLCAEASKTAARGEPRHPAGVEVGSHSPPSCQQPQGSQRSAPSCSSDRAGEPARARGRLAPRSTRQATHQPSSARPTPRLKGDDDRATREPQAPARPESSGNHDRSRSTGRRRLRSLEVEWQP